MPHEHAAPDAAALLQSSAIFGKLSNNQRAEIWSRARLHALLRGEELTYVPVQGAGRHGPRPPRLPPIRGIMKTW